MRIVAGEFRGRRLVAPKGRGIRPTLEVVREAVFDVLGPRAAGARALDLFAGSGAMGLEALSRGAAHVTWCDSSDRAVAAIRENVASLCAPQSRWAILEMPADKALARLGRAGQRFDLVFVDPPWEENLYDGVLLGLSLARVVEPGGLVVVEHSRRFPLSAGYGSLHATRERRYGDGCVTWFEAAGVSRGDAEPPTEV